jgi:putative PIN family toxin of toxin-antitoxin system
VSGVLRIVVDTNILVSAALKRGGNPDTLLRRWIAGDFLIVTCPAAIAELSDVLNRPRIREKYHLTGQDIRDFVGQFSRQVILVPGTSVSGVVTADPKDDIFISCAVEGRARYIISGNYHLQELRRYGRIRIRTVARFLRTLERLQRWRSRQLRSTIKGTTMTGHWSM